MKDKICLITGANTGIGFATAKGLAEKGAHVVMVCRNPQKAEKAREELVQKTGNEQIDVLLCDLSSQKEVRQLAEKVMATYSRLDVLINNAGVFFTEYAETVDGIERQFAINHLSPFLLTNLLLPLLKSTGKARIINTSSIANYKGKIHFTDLNLKKNYNGLAAYRQSKLANVLFTNGLAERLANTDVTANSLHPGIVSTQIGYVNSNSFEAWVWKLANPFMISWNKGAKTTIYLASSEEVEGVSEKYFEKCKPKRAAACSYEIDLINRLWAVSEKMTGLAEENREDGKA
ncbi:SDR family oxidoreductase [Flammeovirgaceae bacterium SG7u.111]|nr:SDR family oxidoreductase [Flammeovirgaceae bacterium SG7u.132]WPO36877.1 SDR family oxidoreductase [Flammeovirgaceae bacterium SG7u.111]